jgi:hypothetical protein
MLAIHPASQKAEALDVVSLLQDLMSCEAACVICADACLSESDVQELAACISLNNECADVCSATARVVARVGHQQSAVTGMLLETCREACRMCAEECEKHDHEHCTLCAESCRRCELACEQTVGHMMALV